MAVLHRPAARDGEPGAPGGGPAVSAPVSRFQVRSTPFTRPVANRPSASPPGRRTPGGSGTRSPAPGSAGPTRGAGLVATRSRARVTTAPAGGRLVPGVRHVGHARAPRPTPVSSAVECDRGTLSTASGTNTRSHRPPPRRSATQRVARTRRPTGSVGQARRPPPRTLPDSTNRPSADATSPLGIPRCPVRVRTSRPVPASRHAQRAVAARGDDVPVAGPDHGGHVRVIRRPTPAAAAGRPGRRITSAPASTSGPAAGPSAASSRGRVAGLQVNPGGKTAAAAGRPGTPPPPPVRSATTSSNVSRPARQRARPRL